MQTRNNSAFGHVSRTDYRDEPALDSNGNIIGFPDYNNSNGDSDTKNVEMMVPLKQLSNIWRSLQMPLINFEISLQLKWSKKCIIVADTVNNQDPTSQINDAKLYVSAVN